MLALSYVERAIKSEGGRVTALAKPKIYFYPIEKDGSDKPVFTLEFDGTLLKFRQALRYHLTDLLDEHGPCFAKMGSMNVFIDSSNNLQMAVRPYESYIRSFGREP